jgi:hypothetical protein
MEKGIKSHEMPRSKVHHHHGHGHELGKLERQYSEYVESVTNVEEVWFAGCHCGSCDIYFEPLYRETHILSFVCTQISAVVQSSTQLVTVLHESLFVG